MKRLLSFLSLFIIGWGYVWATVPLTKSTFSDPANCTYSVPITVAQNALAYGNENSGYADLTQYSKLRITLASLAGNLNAVFDGVTVNLDNWSNYGVQDGNTLIYDLDKVKKAANGVAHLKYIKNTAAQVTINSIEMVMGYPYTWELTEWQSQCYQGWTNNGTSNWSNNIASNWAYTQYGGELVQGQLSGSGHAGNLVVRTVLPETQGLIFNINHTNQNNRLIVDEGIYVAAGLDISVTVPDVKYGHLVNVDLNSIGGHSENKTWSITCNGVTLASGDGSNVGMQTVTIPQSVTDPTNLIITIHGGGGGDDRLGIRKIEVLPALENVKFRYDVANYNGYNFRSNGIPSYGDWNNINGSATIPVEGVNGTSNASLRVVFNTGNVAAACGVSSYSEVTTALLNEYFTVSSSNSDIIDVSGASFGTVDNSGKFYINGVKFKKLCGTATLTLAYKGTDVIKPFSDVVTLTINGKDRQLVWFGEYRTGTDAQPGVTAQGTGWKYRGTPWIRQNLLSCYNLGTWDYEVNKSPNQKTINQNTSSSLAGDIYMVALAFDIDQYLQDHPQCAQYWKKLKYPASNNDFDAEVWNLSDNLGLCVVDNGNTTSVNISQMANYPNYQKYFYKSDGTNIDATMSAIQYRVVEEDVLDPDHTPTKEIEGRGGIYAYKFWTCRGSENDSITCIAYLPGTAEYNPVSISSRVYLVKNDLSMSFSPKEGFVTVGETVNPYINLPDVSLNYVNKVWAWVENENIATISGIDKSNYIVIEDEQGISHNAYVIYQDGSTNQDFVDVAWDQDDAIWKLYGIRPSIEGLTENQSTVIHIIYNTDTFKESETSFVINVLPDGAPGFHWYVNDDGSETQEQHIGFSKATDGTDEIDENGNVVAEYNTIKFGIDDGEVKEIKMYEGDYIYMPGIVGSANGNEEYSYCVNDNNGGQTVPRYYMYSINKGNIVMNYDKYYWKEGVPNYFFANSCVQDGTWANTGKKKYRTPAAGDRKIPQDGRSKVSLDDDDFYAYIFKAYITGRDKRGDTLMVYGAKAGTTYLYAEDPQNHDVCTPIKVTVLPRASLNAGRIYANGQWTSTEDYNNPTSAKQIALKDMSFPFTWDFQHMDMSLIEQDVQNNCASYWEVHRERPNTMYQANGFFNGDWDDKNYSEDLRQRWFKDMTANGEYLPQFKGLMLNIAGMDWWNQKYNRFNISKTGDYIYFEGGPHFLALPGFGIYDPQEEEDNAPSYNYTYNFPKGETFEFHGSVRRSKQTGSGFDDTDLNGTIDGTMFHDNVPGALHDHLNIIHDGFLSNNDFKLATGNLPRSGENNLMNTKVKLIINAYHTKRDGTFSSDATAMDKPHFSIGGKRMMPSGLSINHINDGNNKETSLYNNSIPATVLYQTVGYCGTDAEKKVGHTYVYDINPYDPEYQDNIFIEFDHDVYVNWIAISTEPREMRSDYEMFTYSYPKDIDMDKTNLVMNAVTKSELGEGNEVEFKAMYAKEYNSSKSELTVGDVPDIDDSSLKKFAANEGVLIYPTKTIGSIVEAKSLELPTEKVVGVSSYESKMDYRAIPGLVLQQKADKNVLRLKEITADGKYIYEDATYNHSYYYLPTYFIANAQNVSNYENHEWKYNYTEKNASGQKVTVAYNEGVNRGAVPLINAGVSNIVGYNSNDEIPHNIKSNKLAQSTYKTLVYPDYYTNAQGGNVSETNFNGAQRWISLGLVNEYILRTLQFDQDNYDGAYKELNEYMKDEYNPDQFDNSTVVDERESGYTHSTGYYYFDLIGPKNVRFYRTNNKGNMQCRRAYLELTWEEYMVNTFGKDGVQNEDGGDSEGHGWTPTVTPHGVKANPVKIVFTSSNTDNDDIMVSEDGGFPDGIKEIEQTSSASDGAFYNLNGMRVKSPRSGIYIVNGKKVVVSK